MRRRTSSRIVLRAGRGFLLECAAVKRVRDEFGLMNLKVMIPFCRTPEEGKKVLETMSEAGLVREENGLEVYVIAESYVLSTWREP